jgi:hypothetical protein
MSEKKFSLATSNLVEAGREFLISFPYVDAEGFEPTTSRM